MLSTFWLVGIGLVAWVLIGLVVVFLATYVKPVFSIGWVVTFGFLGGPVIWLILLGATIEDSGFARNRHFRWIFGDESLEFLLPFIGVILAAIVYVLLGVYLGHIKLEN